MNTKNAVPAKEFLESLGAGPTTFASLLNTYRKCEEWTLAEMAKKLKISPSHLSDIEHGRKFVSVERAIAFAKRLKENEQYYVLIALRDELRRANCHYEIELKEKKIS